MALRHEERAALAGGGSGEGGSVDEPHPDVHGVNGQAVPGQVEERRSHDDLDRDPRIGAQEHHRALGHERRTGNCVGDVPRPRPGTCRRHDLFDDGGVDVVEAVRLVVETVEDVEGPGGDVPDRDGRGMVGRAQETPGRAAQGVECAGGNELGTGGAEPHDDHARATAPPGCGRTHGRVNRWTGRSGPGSIGPSSGRPRG